MGNERERPKGNESAPRFQVKNPEQGVFEALAVGKPGEGKELSEVVPPEATSKGSSPVPGEEQTVYDRLAELEQQVQAMQARLDRQRRSNTARAKRYRERHRDQVREYNTARKRKWRAKRRGEQGPEAK
jgi:hypothetical protein